MRKNTFTTVVLTGLTFSQLLAQSNVAIADSLYQYGNHTKAIAYYQKDSLSHRGLLGIAKAYSALGYPQKAIDFYERSLSKDSTSDKANYELGKLYYRISKMKKAFKTLLKLTKTQPQNPNIPYYLGLCVYKENKPAAIQFFINAYKLDPKHLGSIISLARHYVFMAEFKQAEEIIHKGLQIYPRLPKLLNLAAQNYYRKGDYKKAIDYFIKLEQQETLTTSTIEKLADAYMQLQQYNKAIDYFTQLTQIQPNNSKNYFLLGQLFQKIQEYDKALENYKQSLAIKKVSLAPEYTSIAELYQQQKNYKKALDYYKLLAAENPNSPFVHYQIAAVADKYYKDPKLRIRYYEQALSKIDSNFTYLEQSAQKRIKALEKEAQQESDKQR